MERRTIIEIKEELKMFATVLNAGLLGVKVLSMVEGWKAMKETEALLPT